MSLDQPAAFDIAKFKPLSLTFDEAADLVEWALKTETFTSASLKTFTTRLAKVVDLTTSCGGLKLIKKLSSLCLSSFVSSRYRLTEAATKDVP